MAARFWVGGTGNWDAADTTHWAATSGGAGGASVPGASDDVTFDGSSGGGTVTVTATVTVNSITSGAHTGTINTNGQTINTGTWTNSGTGTRTVTLGASAINVTGGTTSFNWGPTTNLTFNSNTSTITINGSGISTLSFGTSLAYYDVVIAPSTNNAGIAVNGSGCSFNTYTYTGTTGKLDQLVHNSTMSATTANLNGNSATNRLLFRSNTLGTQKVFTVTTLNAQNLDLRDISFGSSKDLSAITGNSGDCGGNSGITFTTAATQTATGNSANWSAATWSGRVPLPQDDVVLSLTAGQTITNDMPRMGKSISVTTAMNLTLSTANQTLYGSLDLTNVNTFTHNQTMLFEGRSATSITSAGKSFGADVDFSTFGGIVTLQDAFVNTGLGTGTIFRYGTFIDNGMSINSVAFNSSNSNVRTITKTGIWNWSGTSTRWTFTTTTNLTFSDTGTILISDVSATSKTFAGGGLTYNDLKIAGGGAGAVIITGANTFNRIYTDGGGTKTLTFPAGATTTLSYTGTDNFGNSPHVLTINSSSGGSAATLSKPLGRFEGSHLSIQDSTASGTFFAGSNSTNVSGNSGWLFRDFTPNQSNGLMAWLDALDGADGTFTDRLTKTSYTVAGTTRGANVASGTAMVFDGSNDKITMGNIGDIYSIAFWISTNSTTEQWIDLNGTQAVQIASGTIAATSWTSPTIYVNGAVTSTLGANTWSLVAVTSATAVTASAVVIGQIGADYGAFSMTGLMLFDRILTATEIGRMYNKNRVV